MGSHPLKHTFHAGNLSSLVYLHIRGKPEYIGVLSGPIAAEEGPDHLDSALMVLDHEAKEEFVESGI